MIIASTDTADVTQAPLPNLFEVSIKLYTLVKNYPEFFAQSRLDELVELIFQRYRSILKVLHRRRTLITIVLFFFVVL
jgi:hypothetical protein